MGAAACPPVSRRPRPLYRHPDERSEEGSRAGSNASLLPEMPRVATAPLGMTVGATPLGHSSLVIDWSLGLGHWSFSHSLVLRHSSFRRLHAPPHRLPHRLRS